MVCKFDRKEFRIIELDVLRGIPSSTSMTTIPADTKDGAIKKYYELFPGAGNRLVVVPEECITVHSKGIRPLVIKK